MLKNMFKIDVCNAQLLKCYFLTRFLRLFTITHKPQIKEILFLEV